MLLTRNEFRKAVFARDNYTCVVCGDHGQDAHHIIERRLFSDGGYYLDNGATLCGDCHIKAEKTVCSCETIRACAGITNVVLPEHLYSDEYWDKWGNMWISGGRRIPGELFYDESVQKILEGDFVTWVKYPRTYHMPSSLGGTKDDRRLLDTSMFDGKEVVITEKMDGENSTLYKDYYHARSVEGRSHPSQSWLRNFHASLAHDIPDGWRVCGENLYAKHGIHYNNLQSYFQGFSIWNEINICLDWESTCEWFNLLGVTPVRTVYCGIWDAEVFKGLTDSIPDTCEGYVVRVSGAFYYASFRRSVAKWVKVTCPSSTHNWRNQAIVRNTLDNVDS